MVLGAAVVSAVAIGGTTTVAVAAEPEPQLRLVAASGSVTIDRFGDTPEVSLNLGTYVVAGKSPFEMRLTRKSYKDPIVATQIVRQGTSTRTKTLPAGLVKDFSGLPGFLHVTLTDAAGKTVVDRDETFCPNGGGNRVRPDAPSVSKYPLGCPSNPFTLGAVFGIQKGWASNTAGDFFGGMAGEPVELPDGAYTAKVNVTKKYQDLFGIPANQATVKVTIRTSDVGEPEESAARSATARSAAARARSTQNPKPNAARPTGRASVPNGPKPDLRSLPAWGIEITNSDGEPPGGDSGHGKQFLAFNANVWNAGPSPLVVDGFRRPDQDVMDAYQYFYDAKGKQVGYARTGEMEYDHEHGHEHWHFTDFASYRLLKATKQEAVRSRKEAFCLANTDAVDYTVKNANWRPFGTDLHTACGDLSSLSVREVLDVGSGDTYAQFLPGQSFDITDLPNGTYYIQVIANPDRRLYESNVANNVSLRKVVLGGTPGARTVTVPPHDLIDAP